MRAELKRIQHEVGQTMVYVTHDQVEAMGMADQIAVMDLGGLQQYGSPEDLYERPANTFVARFIGSVLNNFIPARYADGALQLGDGSVPVGDRREVFERRGPRAASRRPSARSASRWSTPARPTPRSAHRSRSSSRSGPRTSCISSTTAPTCGSCCRRPRGRRSGARSGSYFDPAQVHVFDDATGLAVR